jgi:hypothetical protein
MPGGRYSTNRARVLELIVVQRALGDHLETMSGTLPRSALMEQLEDSDEDA